MQNAIDWESNGMCSTDVSEITNTKTGMCELSRDFINTISLSLSLSKCDASFLPMARNAAASVTTFRKLVDTILRGMIKCILLMQLHQQK